MSLTEIFLLQMTGFLLQMYPVAMLYFFAVPGEYLKKPFSQCVRQFTWLFLVTGLGFALLTTFAYVEERHSWWAGSQYMGVVIIAFLYLSTRLVSIDWKRRLLILLMVIQYEAVVVNLGSAMSPYLFPDRVRLPYVPYSPKGVVAQAVLNLVLFPGTYWLMTRLVRNNLRNIRGKQIERGCIYVTLSLGIYGVLSTIFNGDNGTRSWQYLTITLAGLAYSIIIYIIYFSEIALEKRRTQMEEQMYRMEERYQAIQENMELTSRARHDMRHQINAIQVLYEEKNWEALEAFLWENKAHLEKLENQETSCRYPLLDSLLKYYENVARHHGVNVTMDVRIARDYGFDMMDLTTLIGNSLENAVESCRRFLRGGADAAYIHIQIQENEGKLLIYIENTCEDSQSIKDGEFTGWNSFLSKKRQDGYGIGLRSMHDIAQKYQGMLLVKQEHNKFVTKIMMEIP